jgi:hypothetical protein
MEIKNSLSPQFTSKYTLNANQSMPSQKECLTRDAFIGTWESLANNSQEIETQLKSFYAPDGAYAKNENEPCNLTFDIKDADDKNFEECMTKIGQHFDKIA